jgi:hypothetical protein
MVDAITKEFEAKLESKNREHAELENTPNPLINEI